MLEVSARSGAGLDLLVDSITRTLLAEEHGGGDEPVIITRARHHEALLGCAGAVERALSSIRSGGDLEVVSIELQAASLELERIVGSADVDDLLDRIFRRFCIGK
jgi:tRNA modification GTPase